MDELKLCPFCGKPAEPVYINGLYDKAYIICSDHNCLGYMQIQWGTKDNPDKFIQHLKDNWNRRTAPEKKPLTNADRIRSMSNEELAVTLMCPNEMGMVEIECDHSDDKNCCKCLLDWLNQPSAHKPERSTP